MDDIIKQLKRNIIEVAYRAKEGHVASSFSILDILWTIYDKFKGTFILSKAHASLGLYAVLNKKGIISDEEFHSFCQYNSELGGHPQKNEKLGIFASTGSLGHGLPMAVGVALAYKIQNINKKVYCIVGDGECNEGTTWEALLLAKKHKLNNLCVIVDHNHSGDRAISQKNLHDIFIQMGLDVYYIPGHNQQLLNTALTERTSRTKVIVAETKKGNGCKKMLNNPAYHHKVLSEAEYLEFMEELQ